MKWNLSKPGTLLQAAPAEMKRKLKYCRNTNLYNPLSLGPHLVVT